MHTPQAATAGPDSPLDSYVEALRRSGPAALAAAALRTRCVPAREIFAHALGIDLTTLLQVATLGGRPVLAGDASTTRLLLELGRVTALQAVHPTDPADGLALLDLALAQGGPAEVPAAHQGLHAQLALYLGRRDRAMQLLHIYQDISHLVRWSIEADLANPFLAAGAGDLAGWLASFQRFFPAPGIALADEAAVPPFDRLTSTGQQGVTSGELISVVVTTYRPDQGLATAVRSLAAQSWGELEILVVDDASPGEYDAVLRECAAIDDRVRLVRRDANGGTYRARNTGLRHARGEFVTFQDADDWSHPLRLEAQVRPLLADPALTATLVESLNVTDELILTRPGRDLTVPIPTLLMLRTRPVLQRIGYFDGVRKAGDTEYLRRLEAAFGGNSVHRLPGGAYSLHRVGAESLSGADFGPGWVHPARAAYWAAYGAWHRAIRAGRAQPYLPADPEGTAEVAPRRFAAPTHIRGGVTGCTGDAQLYDVIFAGDWREYGEQGRAVVDEALALARRGMRVGVLQLESLLAASPRRLLVNEQLQELINDGTIGQVLLPDEVAASLVVVRSPAVLQFPPSGPCHVRGARVVIVADEPSPPSGAAGAGYQVDACNAAAEGLLGVPPQWLRNDPAAAVTGGGDGRRDLPPVIEPARWWMPRHGPRSRIPVVGVHTVHSAADIPAQRESLQEVYPATPEIDVRMMGDVRVLRSVLGTWHLPPNWLVYRQADLTVPSFLFQLDYYAYFPSLPPPRLPRSVLEAMAAGCVPLLSPDYAGVLGDGGVYCEPDQVSRMIKKLSAEPDLLHGQSERARSAVARLANPDTYYEAIRALMVASEVDSTHDAHALAHSTAGGVR